MDHYALLECSPESTAAELKRAYHKKLREFHPDKRFASPTGIGKRNTQALIDAWEVLRDPARRAAYDELVRRQNNVMPQSTAEVCRREGNLLYKAARATPKNLDKKNSALFRAALAKYSEGITLAPNDVSLWTNRALCHMALEDWARCQDDARHITRLKRDHLKGWHLLVKALLKEGSLVAARNALREALQILPDSPDLSKLQTELDQRFGEEAGLPRKPGSASSSSSGIPNMPNIERKCKTAGGTPPPPGDHATEKIPAPRPQTCSFPSTANNNWFSKFMPKSRGSFNEDSSIPEATPPGSNAGHSRSRSCRTAWITPQEQNLCTCDFVKMELGRGDAASCSFCLFNDGKAQHQRRRSISKQGCNRERVSPVFPRWNCTI